MFAPKAIAIASPTLKGSSFLKDAKSGVTIESIIAVVAVLESHIERKAVVMRKPSSMKYGLEPKRFINLEAISLSILYFLNTAASIKPPRNKMITGLAKGDRYIL